MADLRWRIASDASSHKLRDEAAARQVAAKNRSESGRHSKRNNTPLSIPPYAPPSECLGLRLVDPPCRATRQNLKGDEFQVCASFVSDDMCMVAVIDEARARSVDVRRVGIVAVVFSRRARLH